MKLKKIVTIATVAPLISISGCTSPLVYSSVWQDKPVTVDGKATEWKIPLDYFDDKTKLNFSVSNDKTNLYFCLRATEDETQKGIIRHGLQIWIDTAGGKKKEIGIQFPVIQRNGASPDSRHSQADEAEAGQEEGSVANSLKNHYSGSSKQIRLTGFTNATNGLAEVPNMYGVNACLDWDTNNIMIYEACIPLNTFYKASLSPSDSNKVLGLSFVVAVNPPRNEMGEGGGGGGGMGGGGMGGMHGGGGGGGGGRGGGGHGGGGGGGGASTESQTAYIKIHLATGHL